MTRRLQGAYSLPKIPATTLSQVGEALIAFDSATNVVVVSVDGGAYAPIAGVGAAPGAPVNSVQFNSAGAFAGSADLIFNGSELQAINTILADGGVDTSGPSTLAIGTGNASLISVGGVATPAITLEAAAVTVDADSNQVRGFVVEAGGLGDVIVADTTIGSASVTVTPILNAENGVDRTGAGNLQVGPAVATLVTLGRSGFPTVVNGSMSVAGGVLTAQSSIDLNGVFAFPFISSDDGSSAAVSAVGTGRIRYNDTTKTWEQSADGSAYVALGAAPAGADTQVQFNNAGAFGGAANLTYDGTSLTAATKLNADAGIGRSSAGALTLGDDVNVTSFAVGGATATPTVRVNLAPATTSAYEIWQSANRYFRIDTAADVVTWGNGGAGGGLTQLQINLDPAVANALLIQESTGANFFVIDTNVPRFVFGSSTTHHTIEVQGNSHILFSTTNGDHDISVSNTANGAGRGLRLLAGAGSAGFSVTPGQVGGSHLIRAATGGAGTGSVVAGDGGNIDVECGAAGADGGGGAGTAGVMNLGAVNSSEVNISRAAGALGFHGAPAVTQQTVTGSRAGNAALASALTALANLGLIVDSST